MEKQAEKQKVPARNLEVAKKTDKPKKQVKLSGKKEGVKIGAKVIKRKFKVDAYKFLVRPLITEKVSSMAAGGKYAFEVDLSANKVLVKKAVSALYDVSVKAVKIINVKGKYVRYGRQYGKRKDWKKAIVTLAPGEKIEIYEGV